MSLKEVSLIGHLKPNVLQCPGIYIFFALLLFRAGLRLYASVSFTGFCYQFEAGLVNKFVWGLL